MVKEVVLEARVENLRFRNNENGYTVIDAVASDGGEIVIVGILPFVEVGSDYEFVGSYTVHRAYGEQFSANSARSIIPKGAQQIEKFLATGAIRGIGKKKAHLIVMEFGEKTLEVIEKEPMLLTKIKGIGEKNAINIGADYAKKQAVTQIGMFLQEHEISPAYSYRLFQNYGISTIEMIKKHPYEILGELAGLSFRKIDICALSLGIEKGDFQRIQSGVLHILHMWASFGNTYLDKAKLLEDAGELLELTGEEIDVELSEMVFSGKIKIEKNDLLEKVFLWYYYEAEQIVCKKLLELANSNLLPISRDVGQIISMQEQDRNIRLSENQKNAVENSLKSGIFIITGGPGTGKTTIIDMIIKVLEVSGLKVLIAAPTGRAAKRITQASGYEAFTIHRMLDYYYSQDEGTMRFGKNSEEMLDADAIIIDEASMIDILLMKGLMEAVKIGTRVIFVGDSDQLPSVGAGNVLKDMLASETLHFVKLTEIFRQAEESMIVVNAHRINRGESPYYNEKDKDFFLLETSDEDVIVTKIKELCVRRLPNYYENCDSMRDIQIITPTRKGKIGSVALNNELQAILNPQATDKQEIKYAGKIFREGDRVMQMKNNYKIEWKKKDEPNKREGIFNGEVGYIRYVNKDEELVLVEFEDGKVAEYEFLQLEELDLAYALTVHKSQGSEFPIVIIPAAWVPPLLATRNLLYTAVTRGKTAVIMVGARKYIDAMVANDRTAVRNTALTERLAKYGKEQKWR
ncbi:MAG: SF1B family DNA helicase RecD2 [Eubacteriales bacterium]